MATDTTGVNSVTNTLTGTTADTIRLGGVFRAVEVTNESESVGLEVTFDGVTPVADANNVFYVAPGESKVFENVLVGPSAFASLGCNPVIVVGNGNKYRVAGVG